MHKALRHGLLTGRLPAPRRSPHSAGESPQEFRAITGWYLASIEICRLNKETFCFQLVNMFTLADYTRKLNKNQAQTGRYRAYFLDVPLF